MKHILNYFCLILLTIFIIGGHLTSKEEFPVLKGPYLGQKPPGMKPEVFAPGIVKTRLVENRFTAFEWQEGGVNSPGPELKAGRHPYISPDESFIGMLLLTIFIGSSYSNEPSQDIPVEFDWRNKGIMTPVKHQMNLGSCGVFAAVAVFEALITKETGKTVDLSEQQVINGSRDFVPSGISSVDAMKYIKQYGLVLEERLPYQDKKTEQMPDGTVDFRLTDYHYVQTDKLGLPNKIKTIKQAVLKYGPVATNMIFYQDLDRYKEGVYIYDGKSKEQGGHWAVIVGWKDDGQVKNGGYWICRNSWGPKWGEKGYFKIAYGECGIDDFWFVYGIYKQ